MARNINTGTLTKKTVLEKVSQLTIFSTYLNLSDNIIQHCINTGEFIHSPLRYDINPTVGFKYDNKGKLKYKDFAGYFWGDCFDLVAYIMSHTYKKTIDISKKEDFIKVLRHITHMFKDIFYGEAKDINLINSINTSVSNIRNKKPVIEIVVRDWDKHDDSVWGKIKVPRKDLNINFIYPIDQFYIDRSVNPEPKYFYNYKDPCYAYILGRDREGVYNIKLYFPKRDKSTTRFITNCNHLEGIHNLTRDDYDIIVLTKSTKDRVALSVAVREMFFLYGQAPDIKVGYINLPHETYKLRQSEYDWLKSKLTTGGFIVSLMDNDRTGIIHAIWLEKNYVIAPLLIPRNTGTKDFAEYRERHNDELVYSNINNILQNIKEYESRRRNKTLQLTRDITEGDDMPF